MRKISTIRGLLFTAAMLSASIPMWGQDFTIGTCKYTVNSDGTTVSVSSANKNSTDAVVIPASVTNNGQTYTVTQIAQKGFGDAKMTAITIPATVTTIGNEGLAYCSNLESITFEEGIQLTAINNHTFKNDKKVVALEIPEGVKTIGDWVFEHMDAMTTLTLPSTLTKIGDGALGWTGSMKTLTIKAAVPPTVVSGTFRDFPFTTCKLVVPTGSKANYESSLFSQFTTIEEADFGTVTPPAPSFPADGVTENGFIYTLNDDGKTVAVKVADKNAAFEAIIPAAITYDNKSYAVTAIAANGFQGSKFTKIEIPSSVTTIGSGAFKEAKNYTAIVIPASVATLGGEAFRYCEKLETVTFEEGSAIKVINNHTFNNCIKVKELEIPEGVTTIGDWVFERMNAMTSLTLPSTLTKVGDGSFGWIAKMEVMTVKATTPPTLNGTPFRDFPFTTCKLVVPTGSKAQYQAANGFSSFTTIEEADFGGGGVVTPPVVTFPENGVTANGLVYTLNEDGTTVSVKIADKNASIIANIPSTIIFSEKEYTVTAISDNGFKESKITKIVIPNTVTSIGASAFENAKSFKEIMIPKSVANIGNGAFQWCEGLETITFEAGSAMKSINNHTFKGCKKVKKMVLPEGIATIGEWVFENMESMTVMELPSTLTTIGSGSFQRCNAMMALTVKATTPPAAQSNVFDNFPVNSCTLYVSESAKNAYNTTSPWSKFITISTGSYVEFTVGDFTYAAKNATDVTLISASAALTEVVIPAKVTYEGKEYNVTDLGASVFSGSQITSVTLPAGLKNIGANAFKECKKLTEISFPEGLQSIGESAFEGSEVTVYILPNSVTSLGQKCFARATKELVLSKGLTELPQQMCMYNRLTAIVIPEGVSIIRNEAFYGSEYVVSITLPSTLTQLGHQTFYNTKSLTTVVSAAMTAPKVDSGQKDRLFSEQVYTNATLIVPEGAKASYEATEPWSSFATITEKEILTDEQFDYDGIRYELLSYTTCQVIGLVNDMATSLSIPPAVKYNDAFVSVVAIAENGLANYSFTSVEIAQSVASIGANAFNNVPLTSVKAYALDAPECADNAFSSYIYNNATLYVGAQCRESYLNAPGWKNFKKIVEEVEVGNKFTEGNYTYTILEDECVAVGMTAEALKDMTVTKIVVPEEVEYGGVTYTVTQIADQGFMNLQCPEEFEEGKNHIKDCVGTVEVVLPETIEVIGEQGFHNAHITKINFPASLTTLGENCFAATKLTGTVVLPKGITELPKDAFSWIWTLDRIELPDGLISVGQNCFFYTRIKEVYIPASIETFESGAFSGTEYLQKVEVEDLESFLQIANAYRSNPFSGLNPATKLIYNGEVVTELDFGQFSITEIGEGVISNYAGLKTVIFPDYFTKIGYDAFAGCTGIEEVYCKNEEPIECGNYLGGTFAQNVYNNATLYIPMGTTAAYRQIKTWNNFKDIVEMNFSGVENVSTANEGLSVQEGRILNPNALQVEVYDLTGRILYSGNEAVIKLTDSGVVIVKCGETAIKTVL